MLIYAYNLFECIFVMVRLTWKPTGLRSAAKSTCEDVLTMSESV